MSTTIVTGTSIEFSYTYDEIFDIVSLTTNEIAVTILDKDDMPMIDEYGISEDEQYTVIQKMYDAANDVFNKFLKITYGISDSVALASDAISCKIKDKESYNQNVIDAIDRLMKNSIVNYIIKDWFIDKQLADYATIYNQKFILNLKELVKRSVQLRKPTIT